MKIWKTTFYMLAIIPWTFIGPLLAFYIHAGQVLGHSPTYNQPDPKELAIYADYEPFVHWTATVWLYTFMCWMLLAVIYLVAERKNIVWAPVIVSGVGQLAAVFLLLSGIFEWYID